jgi:hypothetical protein
MYAFSGGPVRRRLFLVVLSIASALLFMSGCSSSTGATPTASQKILRESAIGADWQMYQIQLTLPPGSNFPLLLKLADGDKVDGYFYLEKGTNVDFGINADSPLYHSTPNATGQISSDRFSFSASKGQGSTYSLQFNTTANSTEQEDVFLEVIYPIKGSFAVFVPLETK